MKRYQLSYFARHFCFFKVRFLSLLNRFMHKPNKPKLNLKQNLM